MVSKIILIIACLSVPAGAARTKFSFKHDEAVHDKSLLEQTEEAFQETVEDVTDPSLSDMTPGTQVLWTSSSSGNSYNAHVKSAKLTPMVEIDFQTSRGTKTKWVPLEDLDLQGGSAVDEDDDHDASTNGEVADNLNLRQKIVCDMCQRRLTSCSGYIPSPGLLNPVRPAPNSPNGRYFTCGPSERELWSTDERFKVLEDGTPGEGDRSKCPSERRTNVINGKLSHARRTCKLGLKGVRAQMPCSDLINDVAKVFNREDVTCSRSVLSLYD